MFDGTTLIVDVETLGENSYALSLPAEDLWVAYEVVRRHVDANGVRHYSQMTEAKTTADGYSFKFDTGDTFTCASHLSKPTSSTLSDTATELPDATDASVGDALCLDSDKKPAWATPSSGGGRFVVTFSYDEGTETWSTDKTFAECVAAWEAGKTLFAFADGVYCPMTSVSAESDEVTYIAFYVADAESQTIAGYAIDAEGAYYYGGGE